MSAQRYKYYQETNKMVHNTITIRTSTKTMSDSVELVNPIYFPHIPGGQKSDYDTLNTKQSKEDKYPIGMN